VARRAQTAADPSGEIMKRFRNTAFLLALVLTASWAAAQSRGDGRISGKVVDDQGKPADGVVIRAMMAGQNEPFQAKSNNKGDWSINNIAPGQWNIEFQKDGFDVRRITVELGESGRIPPINVALEKPAPKVDPRAEVEAEGKKAMALAQEGKFADARKVYEDLAAKYQGLQVHSFIARTYAAEKNLDKAIEHARLAVTAEPDNADNKLLLADLLMEKGEKAEAHQLLATIDMSKAPDPLSFINASIQMINDQKPDEALAMLDKVAKQWPQQADTFYYRGRAYIAAKKLPEAKVELEKFVSMAKPDAPQLADAKKLLEQMKDVK
jgi:tetratricopeptide (TPR) repeat protein